MRTESEINREYSAIAAQYGDRVHKKEHLDAEVQMLKNKMNELSMEIMALKASEPPTMAPSAEESKCEEPKCAEVLPPYFKQRRTFTS